jgi:large subunit ribosomal protein L6
MSRIGLKPIALPSGVTAEIKDNVITIKGAKGEVSVKIPSDVSVSLADGKISLKALNETQQTHEDHGTTAAHINNAVKGVSVGFKKELEISGIGFRAQMQGTSVDMFLGYTNDVVIAPLGKGTKISCPNETTIIVEGCDKQAVGQTAALIYDSRRPDVYANKGLHYKGQHMIKKIGKRAAATTAGAAPAAKK